MPPISPRLVKCWLRKEGLRPPISTELLPCWMNHRTHTPLLPCSPHGDAALTIEAMQA